MNDAKQAFLEKHLTKVATFWQEPLRRLLMTSDYACQHVALLKNLLQQQTYFKRLSRADYFKAIAKLSQDCNQATFSQALRQFRHQHLLHLMLLEMAGELSTEEVMRSWSDCTDAILLHTLSYCQQSYRLRYGFPKGPKGQDVTLFIVAMGKLGGFELNYSSDVDLIFVYEKAGCTDGEESIENQHYFTKVVQNFSILLQQVTAYGFVFRVDLRLRPNGESGPLVVSLAAFETYYQEQGRDWERYAMVKARVIQENKNQFPAWYARLIIPFVYRRYVDFSVIESLRGMKSMIEREVQLNPSLNDIKRGRGGIREVEFVIQSFQLIRGGRLPHLQTPSLLNALEGLKKEGLLNHSEALKQAYLFLRRLENSIQALNDRQTHSLPENSHQQAQIALAMDFNSWEELLLKLHQYQRIVSFAFHSILNQSEDADEARLLHYQLSNVWQGHIESSMAVNLLKSLGFKNAPHCYQMIYTFRHSARCRRLTQASRLRLDRFMVLLLSNLVDVENTDEVLLQVLRLLENIVGRSAYLALLTENPAVLTELIYCFAKSPLITSLLVQQPFLLEVFLEDNNNWQPPSKSQLQKVLHLKLSQQDDVESQEELLRQFKLSYCLRASRAELYEQCDVLRIGEFLADLAQVIVTQVVQLACRQLQARYDKMQEMTSHFAIIAYGKLGSREMHYASDLDLVFLHDAKTEDEFLVIRLTQKILHMLTTRSQSGVLYAVDTRLRPSGSSGLLVSHVDAFVNYQKEQAWTWEHQALLKARIVVGKSGFKEAFLQLKKDILQKPRKKALLQHEILEMHAKVSTLKDVTPLQKYGFDWDFLVQFLILKVGAAEFASCTNGLAQIQRLMQQKVIQEKDYLLLKKGYYDYHTLLHRSLLYPEKEFFLDTSLQVVFKKFLEK